MKSGFVTIIGRPNVGKSTLLNAFIGQKIAITSDRPQTTRNRINGVYTGEDGQIVFLDTPGIMTARNKLGEFMVSAAAGTLKETDVALFLTDATVPVRSEADIGHTERDIINLLSGCARPVILVINKVDAVKQSALIPLVDTYARTMDYAEVVPVSALCGRNIEELRACILKYLPEGPAYYDAETVTDQSERQIVAELVREQALTLLRDEVPHGIAVEVLSMKFRHRMADIYANIYCEKESHKRIIIGKDGSMLARIGSSARPEIERLLDMQVNLRLWVKVRADWRDDDSALRELGYYE